MSKANKQKNVPNSLCLKPQGLSSAFTVRDLAAAPQSQQVRAWFTCPTAPTLSILRILDPERRKLKLEGKSRAIVELSPRLVVGENKGHLKVSCSGVRTPPWKGCRDNFSSLSKHRLKRQHEGRTGCRRVQLFSICAGLGLKQPG